MVTLNQLMPHLNRFGVGDDRVKVAINELNAVLQELDRVEVKGRQQVDNLLGCMMAIEQIIGGDNNS